MTLNLFVELVANFAFVMCVFFVKSRRGVGVPFVDNVVGNNRVFTCRKYSVVIVKLTCIFLTIRRAIYKTQHDGGIEKRRTLSAVGHNFA